jgi:hypothetical protein
MIATGSHVSIDERNTTKPNALKLEPKDTAGNAAFDKKSTKCDCPINVSVVNGK